MKVVLYEIFTFEIVATSMYFKANILIDQVWIVDSFELASKFSYKMNKEGALVITLSFIFTSFFLASFAA